MAYHMFVQNGMAVVHFLWPLEGTKLQEAERDILVGEDRKDHLG